MAKNEDKSLEELQRENLRIQNEHLKAQTEFYEEQNEQARARKHNRQRAHKMQEETLAIGRRGEIARWKNCTHRKGGKGQDLVNNQGGDPNFAKIDHTYADGRREIRCSRCNAAWNPGDTAKSHPTGISYEEALRWPTDNSPSAACQFRMPQARIPEDTQDLAEV